MSNKTIYRVVRSALPAVLLALAVTTGCDRESRDSAAVPVKIEGDLLDAPAAAASAPETPSAAPAAPKEVASTKDQFAPAASAPADEGDPNAYDFQQPPAPPALLAAPSNTSDPGAPAPQPTLDKDGCLELTFINLGGWEYQYPPDEEIAKMPEEPENSSFAHYPDFIQELNNKKISVEGYMIPADVIDGKVKSFILIKNQMGCCFGVMPLMNEWIYVTMAGDKTTDFMPDIPLKVKGEFKIGESVREGMVVSIYRMAGESVSAMPGKIDKALGF